MIPREVSTSSVCEGTALPSRGCTSGVRAGNPAEHDRVGQPAAVLGEMAPDRARGAGGEQAGDRCPVSAYDARLTVAARTTRGGGDTRHHLDRVERRE